MKKLLATFLALLFISVASVQGVDCKAVATTIASYISKAANAYILNEYPTVDGRINVYTVAVRTSERGKTVM